ncbi:MAG TPA: nickel pincer cofactor biosynthesis protein LarC [Ilumatobacteraceae bacterium]|nr:nickel pincer cofactor biosynthesis protein LarC [Ilumatobacteraceae bacterium]
MAGAMTTTRRIAWFNCQAGVAGDMAMAALVDAGADTDLVASMIGGLDVGGYALMFERVQRCGVGATWANVVVHDDHTGSPSPGLEEPRSADHVAHRPLRDILELLDSADLPDRVRERARTVFVRLGEVEGAIHDVDPTEVELHEVGALDSIVDVVGVCAALEALDVDEVWCSPVAVGHGSIRSAHGIIPNPAPATVALLAEAGVPTVGLDTTLEVSTPTGVALMATLATGFGAMPPISTHSVGYGAGTADTPERANVVQVVIGQAGDNHHDDGTPVALLEANVDDVTGEVLAHTVSVLLAAGAHDAWLTPIVMKKGRPAHTVSVLCDPSGIATMRAILVRETGTLGVRMSSLQRWPQQRAETTVEVDGHPIRAKVAEHRIKVEFDDAAAAAAAIGVPVRVVLDRAARLAAETPGAGTTRNP